MTSGELIIPTGEHTTSSQLQAIAAWTPWNFPVLVKLSGMI